MVGEAEVPPEPEHGRRHHSASLAQLGSLSSMLVRARTSGQDLATSGPTPESRKDLEVPVTDQPPHDATSGETTPPPAWDQGQDPYRSPSNGMGLAALVVGVVAVILAVLVFPLGILAGIVALVLGIIGRKRVSRREATNGGQATAGIVTGVLAIVIGGVLTAIVGTFIIDNADEFEDLADCLAEAGNDTAAQEECNERFADELGAPAPGTDG